MKSKLNKQQKKYIKACDCKELRKDWKKFFKKENRLWMELKNKEIVFNNGMFTTDNPFIIEFLNGLTENKTNETPNANSLTKETLESLTNPDLIEKKKDFENAIEEFLEPKLSTHLAWNKNETNEIPLGGKIELEEPFKTLEFDLPKTSIIEKCFIELNEDSIILKDFDISISKFLLENTNVIANRIGNNGHSIDLDSMTKEQHQEFFKICNNHREKYGIVSETPKSKIFSEEDMFKCFQGARRMSKFLSLDFESFASYLESLQK